MSIYKLKRLFRFGAWPIACLCISIFVAFAVRSTSVERSCSPDCQGMAAHSDFKLMAGLVPLVGPGVVVTLDDSKKSSKSGENPNLYIIHDDDILRVVNELRAAGAEAISINGQRLIETSEIRCAGPTLSVNNVRSSAPFVISAIGDMTSLVNAINMRGGVADSLSVWGIQIEVKSSEKVEVPAFTGTRRFVFARALD